MKPFEPILEDQPLSYAYNHPTYRNKARENAWGAPVYFTPSTWKYDQGGQSGPGYRYGYPCPDVKDTAKWDEVWYEDGKKKYRRYGNCTWWVTGRIEEITGAVITECIGDAFKSYEKYKGRKENKGFIGDKIQPGDFLVYKDDSSGHVNLVETTDDEYIYISESAYSTNKLYKGMACITYKLKKSDMVCGNTLTLRPKSPYKEVLYGVCHTGDLLVHIPDKVEKDETKDQLYVGKISLNVRVEPNTNSTIKGSLDYPNGYYNVYDIKEQRDYTWYLIEDDCWVAGVKGTTYYPKSSDDYKKLYEEAQKKLDNIKKAGGWQ